MDVLCQVARANCHSKNVHAIKCCFRYCAQAKSGMGKTAVFVLSSLHQLEAKEDSVGCLVLCHTRELAYQICNEFERFSRYLPDIKTKVALPP